MNIDRESFTEACIHLKLLSDAVLVTARRLLTARANVRTGADDDDLFEPVVKGLEQINYETWYLERLFGSVLNADTTEREGMSDGRVRIH
jgi:hypothetical protein